MGNRYPLPLPDSVPSARAPASSPRGTMALISLDSFPPPRPLHRANAARRLIADCGAALHSAGVPHPDGTAPGAPTPRNRRAEPVLVADATAGRDSVPAPLTAARGARCAKRRRAAMVTKALTCLTVGMFLTAALLYALSISAKARFLAEILATPDAVDLGDLGQGTWHRRRRGLGPTSSNGRSRQTGLRRTSPNYESASIRPR
jgi:hypothetical protein